MTKKAIIVDDSAGLVHQLRNFLENELGFQIVAVGSDGMQAVELYRTHRPDFITLDITMPRLNGYEALKKILSEFPDAKVMMISAIHGPEMTRCLKAGAAAYMEKPLLFSDTTYVKEFKASLAAFLGEV